MVKCEDNLNEVGQSVKAVGLLALTYTPLKCEGDMRPIKIGKPGEKYNRLVLIRPITHLDRIHWVCKCDCGNITTTRLYKLITGHTKSCGCMNKEIVSKLKRKYHKISKEIPEYNSWCSMKNRCYNKNDTNYLSYGGRGIKICKRWVNSFRDFYKDMGAKPSKKHSIDRVNNNGDYKPSNCRWAKPLEQAMNKRNNLLLTCKAGTKTQSEWCRILKINHSSIQYWRKKGKDMNFIYERFINMKKKFYIVGRVYDSCQSNFGNVDLTLIAEGCEGLVPGFTNKRKAKKFAKGLPIIVCDIVQPKGVK